MLAEFDEGYFWTLGLRKTRRRKRIRLLTENKSGETESRRLSLLLAGRRTAQGLSLTFFQLLAGTSFFEVSSSRNVPSLNGKESIIIWLPYWNDALNIKCIVLPPILNVNSNPRPPRISGPLPQPRLSHRHFLRKRFSHCISG